MDYTLPMPMSTFQMGETRVCRNITIQEDTIAEVTETFTVTLTGNSVVVSSDASNATVSIEDNDGKFVHNSYIIYIHNVFLDVTYIYIQWNRSMVLCAAAERIEKTSNPIS